MARYDPLMRYLVGLDLDEVSLSFAEVESILGRRLPPSAREHQAWWANTDSHSHARAWLQAGWRTERLDRGGERVAFVRDRASGVAEPSAVMEGYVMRSSDLGPLARRLVEVEAARRGLDPAAAAAALLDEAALERRKALMEKFRRLSPRVSGDSTDLIREDRDAR
jgi:hypothetical protein